MYILHHAVRNYSSMCSASYLDKACFDSVAIDTHLMSCLMVSMAVLPQAASAFFMEINRVA